MLRSGLRLEAKKTSEKLAPWRRDRYFYVNVLSDGSSMPGFYSRPLGGNRDYDIFKHDVLTAPLWQRADKKVVSNRDEEAVRAFKKKYGL